MTELLGNEFSDDNIDDTATSELNEQIKQEQKDPEFSCEICNCFTSTNPCAFATHKKHCQNKLLNQNKAKASHKDIRNMFAMAANKNSKSNISITDSITSANDSHKMTQNQTSLFLYKLSEDVLIHILQFLNLSDLHSLEKCNQYLCVTARVPNAIYTLMYDKKTCFYQWKNAPLKTHRYSQVKQINITLGGKDALNIDVPLLFENNINSNWSNSVKKMSCNLYIKEEKCMAFFSNMMDNLPYLSQIKECEICCGAMYSNTVKNGINNFISQKINLVNLRYFYYIGFNCQLFIFLKKCVNLTKLGIWLREEYIIDKQVENIQANIDQLHNEYKDSNSGTKNFIFPNLKEFSIHYPKFSNTTKMLILTTFINWVLKNGRNDKKLQCVFGNKYQNLYRITQLQYSWKSIAARKFLRKFVKYDKQINPLKTYKFECIDIGAWDNDCYEQECIDFVGLIAVLCHKKIKVDWAMIDFDTISSSNDTDSMWKVVETFLKKIIILIYKDKNCKICQEIEIEFTYSTVTVEDVDIGNECNKMKQKIENNIERVEKELQSQCLLINPLKKNGLKRMVLCWGFTVEVEQETEKCKCDRYEICL